MDGRIIEKVDISKFIGEIDHKNKRFQYVILQAIEDSFAQDLTDFVRNNPNISRAELLKYKETNNTKYKEIRKLILDWSNEYTRAIYRTIFGTDFEGNLR